MDYYFTEVVTSVKEYYSSGLRYKYKKRVSEFKYRQAVRPKRHSDRQTDKQMNRQTGRQTDRQTDTSDTQVDR